MKRLFSVLVLGLMAAIAGAATTTITIDAYSKLYTGTGSADNEVVIETDDVSPYGTCLLQSTTGAMDVFVSVDGTNFATAPYSMTDLGAADATPVLVTAANRTYGIRGVFKKLRVQQAGVTAVANAALRCGAV